MMDKYEEKAIQNFLEGYNCAQSVLLAFKDELDLDESTLAMLSSSFGGGMGKLREVCGAVSAMFMIAGLKYGYADPKSSQEKEAHYELIQSLAQAFKEENGTIICRELLTPKQAGEGSIPSVRTETYYKDRPCAKFVGDAAKIMHEYMKDHLVQKV